MADVQLQELTKIYPGEIRAVDRIDLTIADREFVVLVGPSGCGKTTTLRMIAGLEEITSGTIRIGGRVVNDLAPKDRDVAMVFQNYALYPHMTVYKNMAFGLKLRETTESRDSTTGYGSRPDSGYRASAGPQAPRIVGRTKAAGGGGAGDCSRAGGVFVR